MKHKQPDQSIKSTEGVKRSMEKDPLPADFWVNVAANLESDWESFLLRNRDLDKDQKNEA